MFKGIFLISIFLYTSSINTNSLSVISNNIPNRPPFGPPCFNPFVPCPSGKREVQEESNGLVQENEVMDRLIDIFPRGSWYLPAPNKPPIGTPCFNPYAPCPIQG